MRTTSLRSLAFACLASGLLLSTGCGKRDSDAMPDEDITSAEDRSEANIETAISSDAMEASAPVNVDNAAAGFNSTNAEFRGKFGACATRTYTASTRTLVIDFGAGCACPDGRFRSGQIIVRFTTDANSRIAGSVVRRKNYFVNYNQHKATRTFTDLGSGSFNVVVDSASIIRANNGGTHFWTANWTFARTAGFNTPLVHSDDVYTVTGGANGTNRRGMAYTTVIDNAKPLVRCADCFKYFVSGAINISNSKGKTLVLDYGNGTCDNTATVTVNGRTKTIALR